MNAYRNIREIAQTVNSDLSLSATSTRLTYIFSESADFSSGPEEDLNKVFLVS